MTALPPAQSNGKLETEQNIWLASVRQDGGGPHLVPVWFVWGDGRLYLCIEPGSVKARNLQHSPRVALALEDGQHPVICEGRAVALPQPWPEAVCAIFRQKYEWDITTDGQYTALVEVEPEKRHVT